MVHLPWQIVANVQSATMNTSTFWVLSLKWAVFATTTATQFAQPMTKKDTALAIGKIAQNVEDMNIKWRKCLLDRQPRGIISSTISWRIRPTLSHRFVSLVIRISSLMQRGLWWLVGRKCAMNVILLPLLRRMLSCISWNHSVCTVWRKRGQVVRAFASLDSVPSLSLFGVQRVILFWICIGQYRSRLVCLGLKSLVFSIVMSSTQNIPPAL